ncbi:uncharacterized protein LY89DRAFT_788055, partial [Mollisia scopiformis]
MSQALSPDPRVEGKLEYDREAIIATVTDFYKHMIKLPHIEPSDLLYPPPEGWPSITESNFAPLKRSEEVIELLRHLPYLKTSPGQVRGQESIVAWDTKPIDYREEKFQPDRIEEGVKMITQSKDKFPAWVVPLTRGVDLYGIWLMFDTTDGTATEYQGWCLPNEQDYAVDDPRHWRDKCEGRTMRLRDFFAEWQHRFMTLEWICLPTDRWQLWWE